MLQDAVRVFRERLAADKAAKQAMQQARVNYPIDLEVSPTSPVDPEDAVFGPLIDSQAGGAGTAAGEGSPGGSQAAGGSAHGEGDRNARAQTEREHDLEVRTKIEFAKQHCLPMKGIRESSGRSRLSYKAKTCLSI